MVFWCAFKFRDIVGPIVAIVIACSYVVSIEEVFDESWGEAVFSNVKPLWDMWKTWLFDQGKW